MDKRKHRRLTTRIDVFFSIAQSGIHSGWLLDYGKGGAFLVFKQPQQYAGLADPASLVARVIQIHFSLDDKEHLLNGQVAHISERGIGIKFANLDPMAFAALAECARRNATLPLGHPGSPSPSAANRGADRDVCKQRIAHLSQLFFAGFLEEFIDQFSNRLLNLAEHRTADVDAQACLDAVATLSVVRRPLIAKVEATYDLHLQNHFNGKPVSASDEGDAPARELSLVDKADFEEWLMVKVATSRAELALRQSMTEMIARLASCAGVSAEEEHNPLSPSCVFRVSNIVLRDNGVRANVVQLFLRSLVEHVVNRFAGFYADVNQALVQLGVLPELNLSQTVANRKPNPPAKNTPDPAAARDASAPGGVRQGGSLATPEGGSAPGVTFAVDENLARNSFLAANRLLEMQRFMRSAPRPDLPSVMSSGGGNGMLAEPSFAAAKNLSTEELFKALNRVCNELSLPESDAPGNAPDQLPTLVLDRLKAMNVDCSDSFRDSISMMGSLVANIADEQRMSGELRSEFCKMQVPLAALQVADPEIFLSDQHPVRELLNYLAMLAEPESVNFKANADTVKAVINQLMTADPLDEKVVSHILKDVKKQIEKEKSVIDRNVQRVIESCDGRQRILQANEFLNQQLDQRLANRKVPRVLLQLLDAGWKELMRLSLLRDGPDSRSWQTSIHVVEDLLIYLGQRPCPSDGFHYPFETLLRVVEKGLQKIAGASSSAQTLLNTLRTNAMAPNVDLVDGRQYSSRENATDVQMLFPVRLCKKLQRLKIGQWLEFGVKSHRKTLCQIAWISQRKDKFTLVNQQGMRVVELSNDQFLARLSEGDIQLLNDTQGSAVEKGLDALIQKIYEKISFETSHDQLTGLLSRKEFEKSLAQSVARARRHQVRYALIYVDLMQFKLINSLCGYEGGDNLLQQVAAKITGLAFAGQVCGRIGGNEFALILPVDTDTDAYRYACQVKAAIEHERFQWSKHNHSLLTAVSVCTFDQNSIHVLELLRTVEAATQIAKSSGLKEVQMVKPGDTRFQERDSLMSWVARITNALDNGQLRLRCQKIAPAAELHPNWLPHFEILLTVVDDAGVHIPPAEFIKAAEAYGRMAEVDRWVITQVLSWMKQNERHMPAFGGFSINLSGHTLNDDSFLDFIFEQLVRFGVPRSKVIFEITETTAVTNLEEAADFISEMKEIGCRFSLDDFGTGQSSYAYLKKLPVDFIKIDGAFIRKIDTDNVDYALVKSITEMGHYLNKHMVAEFVSDKAKYDTVVSLGVDYLQGFYFGKPVMLDDLIDVELRPNTAPSSRNSSL